ncbi:PAS domain S-box protein [Novosphingobium sp.]|uniref:PAS domain S-box protein n=1 Tax=Novosphingobium sp. TaxID=1874826 RepID=UPI0031E432B6
MASPNFEPQTSDASLRALNQTYAVATYTPEGKVIGANNQFLRLIGYTLEELVGLDTAAFFSNTYARNHRGDLWRRLAGGQPLQQTDMWIGKHGGEIWLSSRYVPVSDAEGLVEAVVQIAEDATALQQKRDDERGQIEAIQNTQAVIHFGLDGTILDANELFLKAVGYQRGDIIGQHHAIFVDPVEREGQAYADFWQALGRGEHRSGEFRRLGRDGSDVWLQAVYSPILDLAGRPVKVVKYATDITAEKLRRAEYQWQVTAIHKSNAVVTFDMHGTILDANDHFLEATGYALEEIEGRHHRLFVDPAHAHSTDYTSFWRDLQKGRHRAGLYRRFGKDGREVWLQATYNPIFDAGGKAVKVVKYASVVTEERLVQADHQGQIAAIDNAHCVIYFEIDGTIIDANENFLDTMGYRYAQVRGQHHRMFVPQEEIAQPAYATFWDDLAKGEHKVGEYRRIGSDGREVWLHATYNPIRDMNGQVFKIVKYATDVTAHKLRNADYEGQIAAINKSQDVAVFALDGTILDANANFLATMGYAREELIGQHHATLVDRDLASSPIYTEFWNKLKSGIFHSGMYKRRGKNGKEVWLQASYNPIFDLNGQPTKVVKYAIDVSSNVALADAFDEAKRQAHHDSATSLPNRTKLASFMNSALADPLGSMAVFYIDLDRFKPINDTYGHHVGDRVLGEVADRMRRMLREDQIVARVGGDEFVIVAPGMQVEGVERFCRQLFDAVSAPIRHDDGEIGVGLSIGIAISPGDGNTPDELLRAADAALYRSKQNGRGIFSYYSSELNERINGKRKMIEEMRNSLTAGHFFLEYQPRFDTQSREIRSLEALVRWQHPEKGRVNPDDFIALAEQCGLIVPLGEWVMQTACKAAAGWGGAGVSVNVSPVQFRDSGFVQKVHDALAASGLPPHLLEIEITEGVLLEDAERAVEMLGSLKAIGVKLAMDDFGTGYSSLSYLRNFPFDVIKIDRSFVSDLDASDSARPIVQAILGLGKALGLSVTAEGVETDKQLSLLLADQCAEVQGFLMARPLSEAQASSLLRAENITARQDGASQAQLA